MKNIRNYLLLACCIIIAAGCKDSDNPISITPSPGNDQFFDEGINFTSEVETQKVSFTTSKDWEITKAETRSGTSWCRVEPMKGGAGDAVITIEADENTGYDDRSVAITIVSGNIKKTIAVSQKQKDAITVTNSRFDVKPEGQSISIEVKANVTYEVNIPEIHQSWITQEENTTRGMSASTVKLKIGPTSEYDKRDAEITLSDGKVTETIHIYQAGRGIILLNENEFAVSDKGETVQVELSYNFDYEVKMPEVDWISEVKSRGLSSHTLFFTISANSDYDSREAKIIFYDKRNEQTADTLTIIQAAKDAIIITNKEVALEQIASQFEVKVSTNVDLEVTIPDTCQWITQAPAARGLVNKKLTFNVTENEKPGYRYGVILIENKATNLSETVKVVQEGVSTEISLETMEIEAETKGGQFRIKIIGNGPISLTPFGDENPGSSISPGKIIPFEYTNIGDIELKKEIKDGYLHIEVSPTTYAKVNPTHVYVYGKYCTEPAILSISQKHDSSKQLEVKITDDGKAIIASIYSQVSAALGYLRTMEAYYTHSYEPGDISWKDYYDNKLTPYSRYLEQAYSVCYAPMRTLYFLENFADEQDIKTRMAMINFKIFLYSEMVNLWGNVIYVENYDLPKENIQIGEDKLIEKFTNYLEQSVQVFDAVNKYPVINTVDAIFPSKDVPLTLLGRFALHQKNWHKAAEYLKRVVNSGQYSIESSRSEALSANSSESIYSLALLVNENQFTQNIEKNDLLPIVTYTEVLLGLADALSNLGNTQEAVQYIDMVSKGRGINTLTTPENHRTVLQSLWKSELKGTGTYFDFLKRNGLAESTLGIESYRKLFPFPIQQIQIDPNLSQNPGY